ncbi:hypothetical protein GCM10015535_69830 [Streptomyces gelaticus]|uniref:Uncharacterized protein n=1 Tax=Streptomyces gelaticus TaxID=285446 RepID=A0ABQ2WC80_9ACTN|nr:hypothetical protein [Streptomyces gelaticus]GGV97884.1 hypothetical protein GCM10015535_69830 [Streptomyces gelaticus]
MDDDYYRWDGDIDYKSWGYIKITPADLKDLFYRLDRADWPKNLTLQVSWHLRHLRLVGGTLCGVPPARRFRRASV